MTSQVNPIDALIDHLRNSQASLTQLLGSPTAMFNQLPQGLPSNSLLSNTLLPRSATAVSSDQTGQSPDRTAGESHQQTPTPVAPAAKSISRDGRTSNPFEHSLYQRPAAKAAATEAPYAVSGTPASLQSGSPTGTTNNGNTQENPSTPSPGGARPGNSSTAGVGQIPEGVDDDESLPAKDPGASANRPGGGPLGSQPQIAFGLEANPLLQSRGRGPVPIGPSDTWSSNLIPLAGPAGTFGRLAPDSDSASLAQVLGATREPLIPTPGANYLGSTYSPNIMNVIDRMQRGDRP